MKKAGTSGSPTREPKGSLTGRNAGPRLMKYHTTHHRTQRRGLDFRPKPDAPASNKSARRGASTPSRALLITISNMETNQCQPTTSPNVWR